MLGRDRSLVVGDPVYLNPCLGGGVGGHLAPLEQKGNADEAVR